MAKSYVATLIGIAHEEGLIESLNDQVVHYLPELKGSGYDGVTIQNTLNMVTGIEYNEDYDDPNREGSIMFNESIYHSKVHKEYAKARIKKYQIETKLYKGMNSQVN